MVCIRLDGSPMVKPPEDGLRCAAVGVVRVGESNVTEPVVTEIATGLQFPEGPVWMPDGTVLCVELKRRTVDRVHPDGTVEVIAEPGGSPNGLAIGPDGAGYVCNSGGFGLPRGVRHDDHRAEPARRLLGRPHRARRPRHRRGDRALHRVRRPPVDGTERPRVRRDGRDVVHRSRQGPRPGARPRRRLLRSTGRLFDHRGDLPARVAERDRPLTGGGPAVRGRDAHRARVLVAGRGTGGRREAESGRPRRPRCSRASPGCSCSTRLGSTRPATSWSGRWSTAGLTVIPPEGDAIEHVPLPDVMVTNVCFGGDDLSTVFVTASGTGKLFSLPWPRPGLALAF